MTLYIRTQASSHIGMGHFMRCFAIAEAARARGMTVTFLLDVVDEAATSRLAEIGALGRAMRTAVAGPGDLEGVEFRPDDWLVIDSYAATADYIAGLKGRVRTAVIDDLNALPAYDCDLVINPAMAAPCMGYAAKASGRLLLGAAYALIRREFTRAYPPPAEGRSVAVMFGGADPGELTGRCTAMLHDSLPGAEIRVIAGPANIHVAALAALEKRLQNMRLYRSPPNLGEVLAGSELVITAAGGSVGEVAALGLPAQVLVVYDNQVAALEACPFPVIDCRQGLPGDLGARVATLLDDAGKRAAIAAAAQRLVDGKGTARIIEAMTDV